MMLRAVLSLVALLSATLLVDEVSAATLVHPHVHRELQQRGAVNLIVTMAETPSRLLEAHEESHRELATMAAPANKTTSKWDIVRRGMRIKRLVDALCKHANDTQRPLDDWIGKHTNDSNPLFARSRNFWMTNQVFFRNATADLVAQLSKLPGIKAVRVERKFPAPRLRPVTENEGRKLMATNTTVRVDPTTAQWGITKIGATSAWTSGNFGQGVVIGLIDTGVVATHETLRGNFRGAANYGWFDPEKKASEPYDPMSHGTAVASLAAGANGYGVAPGATWMACKSCRNEDCLESDIMACMQWVLCPTDVNGENPDCSKAPHIINNSWGSAESIDESYRVAVRAWISAGIIPVFANGNSGPACSTTNWPAVYPEVISVGASRADDAVAAVSSKGPTPDGLSIKPDIVAPGQNVKSALGWADDAYGTSQGTSLAAPYTSGTIALMLSASGNTLTMDQIRSAIVNTTVRTIVATGRVCGGTPDSAIPNNQFGYGRLDVTAALLATQKLPAATTTPPATPVL